MSKRQRNPFRGFVDVMSELNRVQHNWMQHAEEEGGGARTHATAWVPPADIFARGNDLVIRCELAGMRYRDLEVSVSNGVLTISGERHSELDDSKVSYYTRERHYGNFRRTMILPEGIDSREIAAQFENGLLEVTVRGGAGQRSARIDIQLPEDEGNG